MSAERRQAWFIAGSLLLKSRSDDSRDLTYHAAVYAWRRLAYRSRKASACVFCYDQKSVEKQPQNNASIQYTTCTSSVFILLRCTQHHWGVHANLTAPRVFLRHRTRSSRNINRGVDAYLYDCYCCWDDLSQCRSAYVDSRCCCLAKDYTFRFITLLVDVIDIII